LGSFKTKQPPEIVGFGYVVKSLEAALWAFEHSDSFEEDTLMAVNLGDGTDTAGAIYGPLAILWRDRYPSPLETTTSF